MARVVGTRMFSYKTTSSKLENYKKEGVLYYHWPFCKNICIYCSFNKYSSSNKHYGHKVVNRMRLCLLRETENLLKISGLSKVKSIYFGGGTPSLASPKVLADLISFVKNSTIIHDDAEISIECNPSSGFKTNLEEYAKIGINRISIGLQSIDDNVLKLLGRDHSSEDGLSLFQTAQKVFGCNNVSIDLLFRKPGDTIKSWIAELENVIKYDPCHISLYELTPEKGTQLYRNISDGKLSLPLLDDAATMYEEAVNLLENWGYERYEVSNFVKNGSSGKSQHNQAYWNGSQYVGVGPGAHSRFFPIGKDHREARVQILEPISWQETVDRNGHGTRICTKQSHLEVLSELLSTSLRTKLGVDSERWSTFESEIALRDFIENTSSFQYLFDEGFLEWHSDNLRATKKGLNVIDAITPRILHELNKNYQA